MNGTYCSQIGKLVLFCFVFLRVNGTHRSQIGKLGLFCFVFLCVNGTHCSQIGELGLFCSEFLSVRTHCFQIDQLGLFHITYQYLTLDMIAAAKEKGGFTDQKAFKTAGKYRFDSLILTDANMQVLNSYISYVKPLRKPQCDFVLVNRNGDQHGKLGEIMSKLVFDAIGKYIHPTRYRQIVETQSLSQLTSEEQRILSEDQKHSSAVAKVHYQKQRSRKVALKGHECLQKLQGAEGSEVDEDVYARLGDSTLDAGASVEAVQNISSSPKKDALHKRILRSQSNIRHVLKLTTEEDDVLKKGITKHGFGQWTTILRDHDFKFQDERTADSLKKRAGMKMALV